MPLKTAFFKDGFNRIVTHKKIWTLFMIIYSIQSLIWTLYKIKETKIELYFVKVFTQIIILFNPFWHYF